MVTPPKFRNALPELMRAAGHNDVTLATAAETTKQQINKLKLGERQMSREWAVRLAPHLGVEWPAILGWDPEAPPPARPTPPQRTTRPQPDDGIEYQGVEYAALPAYDVAVSAGPGAMNADHAEPEAWHLFALAALRMVTRAPIGALAMVRVSGDSMAHTLMNGDMILVDRSIRSMGRDGLYVLASGDEVMVKRLSRDFGTRTLTIASDNPAYRPSLNVDETSITILGRVVWLSRNLGG